MSCFSEKCDRCWESLAFRLLRIVLDTLFLVLYPLYLCWHQIIHCFRCCLSSNHHSHLQRTRRDIRTVVVINACSKICSDLATRLCEEYSTPPVLRRRRAASQASDAGPRRRHRGLSSGSVHSTLSSANGLASSAPLTQLNLHLHGADLEELNCIADRCRAKGAAVTVFHCDYVGFNQQALMAQQSYSRRLGYFTIGEPLAPTAAGTTSTSASPPLPRRHPSELAKKSKIKARSQQRNLPDFAENGHRKRKVTMDKSRPSVNESRSERDSSDLGLAADDGWVVLKEDEEEGDDGGGLLGTMKYKSEKGGRVSERYISKSQDEKEDEVYYEESQDKLPDLVSKVNSFSVISQRHFAKDEEDPFEVDAESDWSPSQCRGGSSLTLRSGWSVTHRNSQKGMFPHSQNTDADQTHHYPYHHSHHRPTTATAIAPMAVAPRTPSMRASLSRVRMSSLVEAEEKAAEAGSSMTSLHSPPSPEKISIMYIDERNDDNHRRVNRLLPSALDAGDLSPALHSPLLEDATPVPMAEVRPSFIQNQRRNHHRFHASSSSPAPLIQSNSSIHRQKTLDSVTSSQSILQWMIQCDHDSPIDLLIIGPSESVCRSVMEEEDYHYHCDGGNNTKSVNHHHRKQRRRHQTYASHLSELIDCEMRMYVDILFPISAKMSAPSRLEERKARLAEKDAMERRDNMSVRSGSSVKGGSMKGSVEGNNADGCSSDGPQICVVLHELSKRSSFDTGFSPMHCFQSFLKNLTVNLHRGLSQRQLSNDQAKKKNDSNIGMEQGLPNIKPRTSIDISTVIAKNEDLVSPLSDHLIMDDLPGSLGMTAGLSSMPLMDVPEVPELSENNRDNREKSPPSTSILRSMRKNQKNKNSTVSSMMIVDRYEPNQREVKLMEMRKRRVEMILDKLMRTPNRAMGTVDSIDPFLDTTSMNNYPISLFNRFWQWYWSFNSGNEDCDHYNRTDCQITRDIFPDLEIGQSEVNLRMPKLANLTGAYHTHHQRAVGSVIESDDNNVGNNETVELDEDEDEQLLYSLEAGDKVEPLRRQSKRIPQLAPMSYPDSGQLNSDSSPTKKNWKSIPTPSSRPLSSRTSDTAAYYIADATHNRGFFQTGVFIESVGPTADIITRQSRSSHKSTKKSRSDTSPKVTLTDHWLDERDDLEAEEKAGSVKQSAQTNQRHLLQMPELVGSELEPLASVSVQGTGVGSASSFASVASQNGMKYPPKKQAMQQRHSQGGMIPTMISASASRPSVDATKSSVTTGDSPVVITPPRIRFGINYNDDDGEREYDRLRVVVPTRSGSRSSAEPSPGSSGCRTTRIVRSPGPMSSVVHHKIRETMAEFGEMDDENQECHHSKVLPKKHRRLQTEDSEGLIENEDDEGGEWESDDDSSSSSITFNTTSVSQVASLVSAASKEGMMIRRSSESPSAALLRSRIVSSISPSPVPAFHASRKRSGRRALRMTLGGKLRPPSAAEATLIAKEGNHGSKAGKKGRKKRSLWDESPSMGSRSSGSIRTLTLEANQTRKVGLLDSEDLDSLVSGESGSKSTLL